MLKAKLTRCPLGDFVKQSIREVVRGVARAKTEVAKLDSIAVVNPIGPGLNYSQSVHVECDVVVTASERFDKEVRGGAGIKFWVVTAEGYGSVGQESERSSTNRI